METHGRDIDPTRQVFEILLPDLAEFRAYDNAEVTVVVTPYGPVDAWNDGQPNPGGEFVLDWMAAAGETLSAGTPLAELRADGTRFVIVAPIDGVLSAVVAKRGIVPQGSVIAVMRRSGRAED
jgi:hypothetical protein